MTACPLCVDCEVGRQPMTRDHQAHDFRRLISESDTGMAVYGCTFTRCPDTEVRRKGEPSPFATKREAAKARKKGVPA